MRGREDRCPGLHLLSLGASNAYLLETDAGLTLVDCGTLGDGGDVAPA